MGNRIALLFLLVGGTAPFCLGGCSTGRIYPFGSLDSGPTDTVDGGLGGNPDVNIAPDVNIGPCPTTLLGYATVDGGATGGGRDAAAATATTLDQLRNLASQVGPAVIRISGTIVAASSADAGVSPIEIESDKTIEGASSGGGLFGTGFIIKEKHNVIIRNLTIARAFYPSDAITIQKSDHVWVDHCDLSTDLVSPVKTYDDLIDVTHASDAVTISWNRFHDHINNAGTLVGHSADNGTEDTGHLTVTYHHNLFLNIPTGAPRTRFGHIHVFNNYYLTVPHDNLPVDNVYAIASASAATVLAESNFFALPAGAPIVTHWEDTANPDGTVWDLANVYDPTDRQTFNVITTPMTNWRPPYRYNADDARSVPILVNTCAGAGKVP